MHDSQQKWIISIVAGLLFALVSLPFTYKLTNSVSQKIGFDTFEDGGATSYGIGVHVVIFILVLRLILQFYPK